MEYATTSTRSTNHTTLDSSTIAQDCTTGGNTTSIEVSHDNTTLNHDASATEPPTCGDEVLDQVDAYVFLMDRVQQEKDEPEDHPHPFSSTALLPPNAPITSLSEAEASILRQSLSTNASVCQSSSNKTAAIVQENEDVRDYDLYICCSEEVVEETTEKSDQEQRRPSPRSCAVCGEEQTASFSTFPCCETETKSSTNRVCNSCALILSSPSLTSEERRLGMCPFCQKWVAITCSMDEGNTGKLLIQNCCNTGKCEICNQDKDILVEPGVCDACFLGRQQPLLYECQQCHGYQRIPHPMYRYQPSISEFGTMPWKCNAHCEIFTHWRIRPDQLPYMAAGDTLPWENDHLEVVRQRVRETRTMLIPSSKPRGDGHSCIIL